MNTSELNRQERAMKDALIHGAKLDVASPEAAMIARHACVLASGYLENIVKVTLTDFVRFSNPKIEIREFVEDRVDLLQNPEWDKIIKLTATFSEKWAEKVRDFPPEIREAINSVVANRHLIVHGGHSGISMRQIQPWALQTQEFRKLYAKVCR